MSNRKLSLRFVSVILAVIAIAGVTQASPWSQTLSFFGITSDDNSKVVHEFSTNALTPGTCGEFGGLAIEVEASGGTNLSYATLTAAFAAINAGTHTGAISIDVCGSTDEGAGTASLNASGVGSASYSSIAMSPVGGVARTITGATTAGNPLIDFNGADNVTIDGLNTGSNALSISNTTVSATSGTSTIRFQTDATGNTITNAAVLGSATMAVGTNGGNIWFGSAAVTTGNDNNTISNCNIGPAGANLPTKGIYFSGSSNTDPGTANSGIVINNNNIFDYFNSSSTSSGVYIGFGTTRTTISNNRFYQSTARVFTVGVLHSPITISNTSGNGYQIIGNTIGFATNSGTGTYSLSGSTNSFRGINLSVGSTTATSVQGNTIAGISQATTTSGTSSSSVSMMIYVSSGLATIGDITGNTIGSQSATGSISYTSSSTSNSDVMGIFNFGSSNFTTNNNNIGGITASNSSSGAANIYGIRTNTGSTVTWTCLNNTIGGSVANSINSTSIATGTIVQGILNSAPLGTFTGNTIRNLTAAGGTGTSSSASVAGIMLANTVNNNAGQNTIFNLNNTNTLAATVVTGIQGNGGAANVVERNLIYGLSSATTSAAAEINGIRVGGGTTLYRNNMIDLGLGTANALGGVASNSSASGINGINEFLGTNQFFHNSVLIRGAATSGTGATYAFNGTQTANTRSFRDNIFFNARTNSGATGKNYAVKVNGTAANPSGLTINNNIYFANGSGGAFGFFNSLDVANLAGWRTAVGQDSVSFEVNPQYADISSTVPDLHLNAVTPTVAEANGADVGVIDDFDGQTRASLTPVDIGADAGNYNGIDLAPPTISYTSLPNTSSTANRLLSVTMTDVSGIATGGNAPRIYFNKNAGSYFSTACSLSGGTVNSGTWSCTIDNALVGGVVLGDVIRSFLVAQDIVGNLAANPSAGFSGTNVNSVTTPPTTPNQYTIVGTAGGSYNVGTTETVTSLTNAGGIFEFLNNSEVTGNVTINITSDLVAETGTIALNQFSPGFTVTIKPSGAARILSGSTSANAMIRTVGASGVTIDGSLSAGTDRSLTIANTSITTPQVVRFGSVGTAPSINNTLRNTIISNGVNTSSAVVILGNDGLAGYFNNVTIQNNDIRRAFVGVFANAAVTGTNGSGTVYTQNKLDNTGTDAILNVGLYVQGVNGGTVSDNNIGNLVNTDTSSADSGIWMATGTSNVIVSGNTVTTVGNPTVTSSVGAFGIRETSGLVISGNVIRQNTISNIVHFASTAISGVAVNAGGVIVERNNISNIRNASTSTFGAYGIDIQAGDNSVIRNNFVSGVTGDMTGGAAFTSVFGVFGIRIGGGINHKIYNNSVNLSGLRTGTANSSLLTAGLVVAATTSTGLDIRNNIFANNITGGTTSVANVAVALPSGGTAGMNLLSNNNSYYYGVDAASGVGNQGFTAASPNLGTLMLYSGYTNTLGNATNENASLASTGVVPFASLTDLHISTSSPEANVGLTLASVVNDFDNEPRPAGTAAEIGADELTDTTAPDTTILTNPTNPSNSSSATFTFSGTDALAGGDLVASFECQIDGGGFTACISPKTYIGLSQGTHTFQVRAKDTAGNVDPTPATFTWFIDAIAPDTQILTTPTNPTNSADAIFTFSGSDSFGGVVLTFQCRIDGGSYSVCTSPTTYTALTSGSHTFDVRAVDSVGNIDQSPASFTWVIDLVNPDTQILTNPSNPSTSANATFTFSGTDSAIATVTGFQCQIDGGGYTACSSPITYSGLSAGPHTFQVRAVDGAGNVDPSPAMYPWTIILGPVGPVSVSATAGTTGLTDYPTLKAAFDAVNAGTHQGVISVIVLADVVETSTASLNASGAGSAVYTSVSVQPSGGAARTISGSIVGSLVELNGADNVTIDGLNSVGNSLTFSNAALGASSTIRFTNDASNNTVTRSNIQGSGDTSFGVVYFGTGTTTGNDANTVSTNNIGPAGANLPINGIYSFGSSATIDNSGNTIFANNIFDYFSAGSASNGINVNSFNSGWTISNNQLYQTATRTYTTASTHNGITISSGNGYTLAANQIGFAAANGTGVYTMAGTVATRFSGITLALAPGGIATTVQGNTVAAISLATSSGAATTSGVLCGLNITSGDVNVGTNTPNTFGSTTGTGSLVATPTTTQGAVVGINAGSTGTINIVNNTFGGFTSSSPTATVAGAVFGINVSATATAISITGNIIGNATANNMLAGVSGTTTGSSLAAGINQVVSNAGTYSGNMIQNLTSFGTGTAGYVRGIATGTAANTTAPTTISNNVISNLTTSGATSGQTSGNTSAYGIHLFTGLNSVVSGNTISNIANINSAAVGTVVTGITTASATSPTISNNKIYGLSNASTATSTTLPGVISGVLIRSGVTTVTVQNNMISLGTSQATNSAVFGIWANHGSTPDPTDRIYYNSVNIEGTVTTGAQPSAAYHRGDLTATAKNPVQDVRNNIFINNRSGGTGKHYAIANHIGAAASVATGWTTVNNNVLNANASTVGFWTTDQTFAGWKAASSGDSLSYSNVPVTFVNNVTDLHLNMGVTPTSLESGGSTIAGVNTDIDGQTRPGPSGSTNGGAFAPDIGADEFDGVYLDFAAPIITYTALANTAATTNRTLSINVADGTGVASGANLPRVYFKKSSDATYVSTACSLTSGTPQNGNYDCTIDYALVGGGSATTFDTVQYFVVAQDTLGNLASTPGAGFSGTSVNSVTTPPTSPNLYFITGVFNGTYTVGSGGTFASLTNSGGIFDQINNSTVTGNVTINIVSNLSGETGAIVLNEIAGGFSLTIKPSGAARTISGTSPTINGLISFSGADGVTIDGSLSGGADRSLSIIAANAVNSGGGIYFASGAAGAQNNTIKNVNIVGNGSTTGLLLGISFGGNTFGGLGFDNDGNRVENCDVRGAFYGIASLGASAANKDTGLVITRNVMPNLGTAGIGRVGIYVIAADGAQITQNNIASVSNPGSVDTIGIAAGTQGISSTPLTAGTISNILISGNYVGVVSNNSTFSAAGIVLASDTTGTNNLSNNMVTGVTGNSNAGDIVAGIYVNGLAGSTQNVYHNSVSMTGDRLPITANMFPSYALVIATDQPANVVDNALFNSQTRTGSTGGGGESYAIGFDGPAANVNLLSNYNDLFVSGVLGVVGVTGDLTTAAQTTTAGTGTNQSTLAAWQTATTEDANSISADPLFTSLTDLHIPVGSPLVNVGTNVGVTTDFDGQTRDVTPDIGADEFVAPAVPGTLALSSATYSTSEANTGITITVNRTVGTDGIVGATYALTDGTATGGAACGAGIDYVNTGGTVSFGNGIATQTFNITLCPDALNKVDETFNVTLSAPTGGATLGSPTAAVVTITNDDPVPSISINDVTLNEGNAGTTSFTFNVTLSAASGQTVTVNYATANGTAIAPGDYTAITSTLLTFSPGQTTLPVTVSVNGDTTFEPNETFFVNLTSPVNATISDAQGLGTITNDDVAAGSFSINDVRVVEGNSGTVNATFIVTYTGGAAAAVQFATANRTALAGPDYVSNTNTLNFPASPGSATQTVTVVVNGDTLKEANETFAVNLSNPTNGATITDSQGIGIIVDEDRPYVSDFDRDLFADFSVFRPSEGRWYTLPSSTGVPSIVNFGTATDRPVPADYDGDGKTDIAYYRPSTSAWSILNSSTSTVANYTLGIAGDKPVQGDYNGDGRADLATFRPSNGLWSIFFTNNGDSSQQVFGISTDRLVQADYDGDFKTDLAVYRDGVWYILQSSTGTVRIESWGVAADKPVIGDFDGDGQNDLTIYRNGQWWTFNSLTGQSTVISWGLSTDITAAADYDRDGTTDVAIYRPSTGDWYVLQSATQTITGVHWGTSGDIPIPNAYLPQ